MHSIFLFWICIMCQQYHFMSCCKLIDQVHIKNLQDPKAMINIMPIYISPEKKDKEEMYVHVCGTAQIYYMATITQLHCKEQCHLSVCFQLSQLFLCIISIIQTWQDAVKLYNLPDSTRECCVVSWAIFLLDIWRSFRLLGHKN